MAKTKNKILAPHQSQVVSHTVRYALNNPQKSAPFNKKETVLDSPSTEQDPPPKQPFLPSVRQTNGIKHPLIGDIPPEIPHIINGIPVPDSPSAIDLANAVHAVGVVVRWSKVLRLVDVSVGSKLLIPRMGLGARETDTKGRLRMNTRLQRDRPHEDRTCHQRLWALHVHLLRQRRALHPGWNHQSVHDGLRDGLLSDRLGGCDLLERDGDTWLSLHSNQLPFYFE